MIASHARSTTARWCVHWRFWEFKKTSEWMQAIIHSYCSSWSRSVDSWWFSKIWSWVNRNWIEEDSSVKTVKAAVQVKKLIDLSYENVWNMSMRWWIDSWCKTVTVSCNECWIWERTSWRFITTSSAKIISIEWKIRYCTRVFNSAWVSFKTWFTNWWERRSACWWRI